jgi:hypothetical protein
MLHHLEPKPSGEGSKKENIFNDIRELPRWQLILEMAGYLAALLVIAEFLSRLFFFFF